MTNRRVSPCRLRWLARSGLGLLLGTLAARGQVRADGAAVVLVDDETRLRRGDGARALAEGKRVSPTGDGLTLAALRGETVAFQIVVVADATPVGVASVVASELQVAGSSAAGLRPQVFREHYVSITERSHGRRPGESLGWTPGARAGDELMLGEMPDALIPIELDARPLLPGPAAPAHETGAFWLDVHVPEQTAPASFHGTVEITADGARLARFPLTLVVHAARLPYRPVSVFAYYETDRLESRIGDGARVERQLWQLLHEHHIDALAPLLSVADVLRLGPALDGTLFLEGAGYHGPGAGVAPAVIALGTYGQLGDPTPEAVALVEQMVAAMPATARASADIFQYAIDERCDSPRAADWKRALAGRPGAARVRVGHTCSEPPETQAAQVVMMSADSVRRANLVPPADGGRSVWVYNGGLPRSGTIFLDADPRGLVANGWIAALAGIERWFWWETIFWDDSNQGGRGPVDPFVTAAGFHNADGDTDLADGLLLYPGRQRGAFAGHSLGWAGVLPSLRLKALRRGIEDAGYLALVAATDPAAAARVGLAAVPRMLDEAPADRPAAWQGDGRRFSEARAVLRGLITRAEPPSPPELRRSFVELAERRRREIAPALTRRQRLLQLGTGFSGVAVLVILALWLKLRRRPPATR